MAQVGLRIQQRISFLSTQQQIDEHELLQRVVAKDQAALATLYDRYARAMLGVAYKIVGSLEEAEEVVLDVFGQVWRTAETYSTSRGRLDSWLFMMTRSRSLDRIRALQRTARASSAAEEHAIIDFPSRVADPEQDVLVAERRQVVADALGGLPEGQRAVLELAYYKGLSHSEIAAHTGEALGTVKTRVRLGLSKLKEALAPFGGGASR